MPVRISGQLSKVTWTQCWLPVNSAGQHWLVVPVTTCHQEMVLETTVLAVLCELLGVHQQQTALRDTRPNPMVLFSSDVRGRWSGLCETKSLWLLFVLQSSATKSFFLWRSRTECPALQCLFWVFRGINLDFIPFDFFNPVTETFNTN